jgi:RHS repeat-associated protein
MSDLITSKNNHNAVKMEQHVVRKILVAFLAATCSFGAAAENLAPTVALTAPAANTSFVAPAAVTLSATADDSDGTVAKVEFFNGTTLVGTATQAPYTFAWNAVAAGSYAITAIATDDLGQATTSTVSNITVGAAPTSGTSQVFYIHSDQINTAREISNAAGVKVWEGDPEPFGANLPNENPAGQGAFTYNPRFPGQYFDRETGLHYNYYRDYDPQTGRYVQSDPIGLAAGINTYNYVDGKPLSAVDPSGLASPEVLNLDTIVCRGGTCTAELFRTGSGVNVDYATGRMTGVSTNSANGLSLKELTCNIKHGSVGTTTVGDVIAAGGTVTPSPTRANPSHATVDGLTPEQAEGLFRPNVVRNPSIVRGGAIKAFGILGFMGIYLDISDFWDRREEYQRQQKTCGCKNPEWQLEV